MAPRIGNFQNRNYFLEGFQDIEKEEDERKKAFGDSSRPKHYRIRGVLLISYSWRVII